MEEKIKKQTKKVCIIDDEPIFIEMYAKKFKDAGYKVISATNIRQGFEVIKDELPDIVFLDIVMPGGENGMDLLAKCKRFPATQDIPVVLLTNLDSSELREQGCRIGALYFLTKASFLPSEVVDLTEEILAVRDFEKKNKKNIINDRPYPGEQKIFE
ncbi:MAG: response regulator [Patescibacteria group bacterium]|nr:response regulator [Patescibacteria group bacterium]